MPTLVFSYAGKALGAVCIVLHRSAAPLQQFLMLSSSTLARKLQQTRILIIYT
jgi:hypothetical protein